jgi:hypothetical protein
MNRVIWCGSFVPRFALIILLVAALACEDDSCPVDLVSPGLVSDLTVGVEEDTLIVLNWTAPADDGPSGAADAYDIRYSLSIITDESFSGAPALEGEPTPKGPGVEERFVAPNLRPDRSYYFALRALDRSGNASDMSNVALLDLDPPAAVGDLAVTRTTSTSAELSWTSPAENGLSGKAASYDLRYSMETITEKNWESADTAGAGPVPGIAGMKETTKVHGLSPSSTYSFAVRSSDESGNVSSLSNVVEATTAAAPAGWWDGFGGNALDKRVYALMPFDGNLAVGGEATVAGETGISHVAFWDGESWSAVGEGFTDGGGTTHVGAFCTYGGDLIAAGNFGFSGIYAVNSIARWDGADWLPLHLGIDNCVMDVAVYNDELYAAGLFYEAGGREANGIARWDGSRWHSMGWLIRDVTGVASLTTYNNELIAGGMFTKAHSVPAQNIAKWDGSGWTPLGEGFTGGEPFSMVRSLAVYDGYLIAAGTFRFSGDTALNNIARWDGSSWSPLGDGIVGDQQFVGDMTVYNGTLVVGGRFHTAGGVAAANIARWDGAGWSPLGDGLSGGEFGPTVRALAVHNGSLYVGGDFTVAGTQPSSFIARWDD